MVVGGRAGADPAIGVGGSGVGVNQEFRGLGVRAVVVVAAHDIGFAVGIDVDEAHAALPGRVIVVGRGAGTGPVVGRGAAKLRAVDEATDGAAAIHDRDVVDAVAVGVGDDVTGFADVVLREKRKSVLMYEKVVGGSAVRVLFSS